MKLLYVTDLHGVKWKFKKIFQKALSLNIEIVINGGDMLPFGNFFKQDEFLINFLDDYLSKFEDAGIYHLGILGNDDLIIYDELFEKICDKFKFIYPIAQKKCKINNYEFIGMNWVSDLPFALKDRARKDSINFTFPKQFGKPVISSKEGWKKIDDWYSYVENLPTIEDELKRLVIPDNFDHTICVFHMPPADLNLDICHDGRRVGSKAIHNYIAKNQPKLTLHGHIHESPNISGHWFSHLGKTLCIQPGQSLFHEKNVYCCIIDLDQMNFERLVVN